MAAFLATFSFSAWDAPCRPRTASVLRSVQEEEPEERPGIVALGVLRRMLQQGTLSEGQQEDLEYVYTTLEDLALKLRGSGKLAEETAQRRISIGSENLNLEETTEEFLMTFTQRQRRVSTARSHVSFRTAAKGVCFALRAAKQARVAAQERSEVAAQEAITFEFPVQRVLDKIDCWNDFDVFRLSQITEKQPLQHITLAILQRRGLLDYFKLPLSQLQKFLAEIENTYLDNPYHNSVHAADVTQALHLLLMGADFSELEVLAAFFAAVCHDAGHPGVTNDFRVQSADDCAITYNDRSVNENMHCCLTYRLLKRDDCNFLTVLSADQRKLIRRLMIDLVLATDMVVHFTELEKFQAGIQRLGPNVARWEDSDIALKLALHAADLSNVCRPVRLVTRWTDLVLSEFFAQGDRERIAGRPVSPLCDRETVSMPDSQLGFIDFIVKPLYEAIAPCFNAENALDNLARTRSMWVEEKEKAKLMRKSGRRSGSSKRPSGASLQFSSG